MSQDQKTNGVTFIERFGEKTNAPIFEFVDLVLIGSNEEQFDYVLVVFWFGCSSSIQVTGQQAEHSRFNVFDDDGASGRLGHIMLEHGSEDRAFSS